MNTRTFQYDPILAGIPYALPDGVTVWLMPPLPEDASDEQRAYRRWALARLDMYGHWVIEGDQTALALAVQEAREC